MDGSGTNEIDEGGCGNEGVVYKLYVHQGGGFLQKPFKYVGGFMKSVVTSEYWLDYNEFKRFLTKRGFKNVKSVYCKVSSNGVSNADDVRLVWDEESAYVALQAMTERGEIELFIENHEEVEGDCNASEGVRIGCVRVNNRGNRGKTEKKDKGKAGIGSEVSKPTQRSTQTRKRGRKPKGPGSSAADFVDEEEREEEVFDDEEYLSDFDEELREARLNLKLARSKKVIRRSVVKEIDEAADLGDESDGEEDSEGDGEEDREGEELGANNEGDDRANGNVGAKVAAFDSKSDEEEGANSDETQYLDSDDAGSEDSDGGFRSSTFPYYNPNNKISVFELGMKFVDAPQVREAFTNYAIETHRNVYFTKNERLRLQVMCAAKNCGFKVWISENKRVNCLQIKTLRDKHKCRHKSNLRLLTTKYVADRFKDLIRDEPYLSLRQLRGLMKREMKVNLSVNMVKRAKGMVKYEMEGNYKEEYRLLWAYKQELLSSNPGSTVELDVVPSEGGAEMVFRGIYICFSACRRGFLDGCRPIIGVDGCFLKGFVKGEILTAVGRDGNDQMYPVAWAVVLKENKYSWTWFLTLLIRDLGMHDTTKWTIISDQQKGLMPAVAELLPGIEHRLCARHICANFAKKFPGDTMKGLFWNASKSTNERKFNDAMERIDAWVGAKSHLLNIDPRYWCKAFFKTYSQCDVNHNNLNEAFNGVRAILEARTKPIFSCLEDIRRYVMKRIADKRAFVSRWNGNYGKIILDKLSDQGQDVSRYEVIFNGDSAYEVRFGTQSSYAVNLRLRTCTCRLWNLSGIPCRHAIAVIEETRDEPEKYLSGWYHKITYMKCYAEVMQPLGGPDTWVLPEMIPIAPPELTEMSGRPKKVRKKEATEGPKSKVKLPKTGLIMNCTICKETGHNRTTCKGRRSHILGDAKAAKKNTTKDTEKGAGQGTKTAKHPFVGIGVYTNPKTGFTVLNPGMPSNKILQQGRGMSQPDASAFKPGEHIAAVLSCPVEVGQSSSRWQTSGATFRQKIPVRRQMYSTPPTMDQDSTPQAMDQDSS